MAIPANPASPLSPRRLWWRALLGVVVAIVVLLLALMWWWDTEPEAFDVDERAAAYAKSRQEPVVTGSTTAVTLIEVANTLLDKRGGYLANDVMPPGMLMDNVPNWEFGVVLQIRDLAQALRNDFSRSQTQSIEDDDLREAFNYFSYKHRHWILPSTESQLRAGVERVDAYLTRLSDSVQDNAQFYARADNLATYLGLVEKRLGSLSQRLSASVGQERINTDLANDPSARQSKPVADERLVKTPWSKIDDVFYEARGSTWALLHFLRAIEHDFGPVLRDKNAQVSLRQIIRELEESQVSIGSPVILNGSQYGFFANHSLVMANYVSRANAAVIELRQLLDRG
jgi:hypothetical protein